MFVTFDFIDKNVRLIQLANSGETYPKLEKNENPFLSAKGIQDLKALE